MGELWVEGVQVGKICEIPARAHPKFILAYFIERGSGCAVFVTPFSR